jgi:hypothetical protein
MVFSKSVLELGIWAVLSSHLFLTIQTASSHLDYSYCLITHTWNLILSWAFWALKKRPEWNHYYKITGYFANCVRPPVVHKSWVPEHPTIIFCTVTPNNCGCSVWSMHQVTLLAPKILRWLPDSWEKSGHPLWVPSCVPYLLLTIIHAGFKPQRVKSIQSLRLAAP